MHGLDSSSSAGLLGAALDSGDALLLVGGGLFAGVINTLAGGGSMLSVPLLVLLGLPGTVANGTNRVGILIQNGIAAATFRGQGVSGFQAAGPILLPVALGAVVGAGVASRIPDALFERIFGVLMLLLLVPMLLGAKPKDRERPEPPSGLFRWLVFVGIGLYGGAFQAGVGLFLVFALHFAGFDLVRANAAKVVVNFCFTLLALPVFVLAGQVAWIPALALGAGFAGGGVLGARLAVRGGERLIRPVLVVCVVALAGRMFGLY